MASLAFVPFSHPCPSSSAPYTLQHQVVLASEAKRQEANKRSPCLRAHLFPSSSLQPTSIHHFLR